MNSFLKSVIAIPLFSVKNYHIPLQWPTAYGLFTGRCSSPGFRLLSPGLLQLSVLRQLGRTDEPVAVGSERCCQSGYDTIEEFNVDSKAEYSA